MIKDTYEGNGDCPIPTLSHFEVPDGMAPHGTIPPEGGPGPGDPQGFLAEEGGACRRRGGGDHGAAPLGEGHHSDRRSHRWGGGRSDGGRLDSGETGGNGVNGEPAVKGMRRRWHPGPIVPL